MPCFWTWCFLIRSPLCNSEHERGASLSGSVQYVVCWLVIMRIAPDCFRVHNIIVFYISTNRSTRHNFWCSMYYSTHSNAARPSAHSEQMSVMEISMFPLVLNPRSWLVLITRIVGSESDSTHHSEEHRLMSDSPSPPIPISFFFSLAFSPIAGKGKKNTRNQTVKAALPCFIKNVSLFGFFCTTYTRIFYEEILRITQQGFFFSGELFKKKYKILKKFKHVSLIFF